METDNKKFYNTYHDFMKKKLGSRVYKISIDAGFSCPNRDGKKGVSGCIFCDERGSSSRTCKKGLSIKEQIFKNMETRKKRYKAKKFIAYFQSFSNTYDNTQKLKYLYDLAIGCSKDIIGLNISTRSDCIDEEKIKMIASYKKKLDYVAIEYGLQTIHNRTLKKINRCEKFEDFLKALKLTKKYKLNYCVHVILNLPGESSKDQMATAEKLAELKIEGIKIHLLAAMKKTKLEKMYKKNLWNPFSFEKSIKITCDFIERLNPECIIHRASKSGYFLDIIAPLWMKEKKINFQEALKKEFFKRNSYQGSKYRLQNSFQRTLGI